MRGILDTSVFIAQEQERPIAVDLLPDEAAISIVSLAELELGVHMAATDEARARRLVTLRAVQTSYWPIPIDESVASTFAQLVATARRAGRRPKVQDSWIAATAMANDAPLFTQDNDFEGLAGIRVIHV